MQWNWKAYNQRTIYSQNLVHLLQNRESGYTSLYNSSRYSQRPALSYEQHFYKSITPCLTINNLVILPPVSFRKFTPDGSKLLAMSYDQRALRVFAYKGISAAGSLLSQYATSNAEHSEYNSPLRKQIFNQLFKLKYSLPLCQGEFERYHLHREFSIFFEDGRYVLLAAMRPNPNAALKPIEYERYPDVFDQVDGFSYVFFVVNLEVGFVCDLLYLPLDAICMSHNYGVSAYNKTIAILSRLRQSIEMYELVNGKLFHQETIGPHPRFTNIDIQQPSSFNLHNRLPITHIKQRVLSFLYKQIENREHRHEGYRNFYKKFDFLEFMIIEKMQLVNSDLLLLRYEERPKSIPQPVSSTAENTAPRRLYVFYTIQNEEVIEVYDDDSIDLLRIVHLFYDDFCNVRSLQTLRAPFSPIQHCITEYFTLPFEVPRTLRQAAMRYNPGIPISTQSFSTTPYLNYNTFRYDDKHISPLERPKIASLEPILIRERISNIIKFRLNSELYKSTSPRELSGFIFHPFEPLVLSIQKYTKNFFFNMHIYNHATIVKQQY